MRLRDHLRQFDGNFWRYLGSYSLFWFGVFIFAELYALYMRELGYGVVVLGNASVALNLGSIAGTIPAVFLMRRLGLARTTAVSFAGASVASAVRLWHDHALAVYGGAFAAGFTLECVGRAGVRRAARAQPSWPGRAMDHGMEM